MEAVGATSSDALVLSHFSRQIFQALGYPDRRTAIIKRKWRVAVRRFHIDVKSFSVLALKSKPFGTFTIGDIGVLLSSIL